MSYTKRITKEILIDFEAYDIEGKPRTYHLKEPVDLKIEVDTTPFDKSISNCKNKVGNLTDSVKETNSKQVESIYENSKKVGDTIINGVFKTISSGISQQITELSTKIEATLLHLDNLKKQCLDKKRQMGADYNRLSTRYYNLFKDLDKELENRVYALNKPICMFKDSVDLVSRRTIENGEASLVAVSGLENGKLDAQINSSITKEIAYQSIDKAKSFLTFEKKTNNFLKKTFSDDDRDATYYVPLCFVETKKENLVERKIFKSINSKDVSDNEIINNLSTKTCSQPSKGDIEKIRIFFNKNVANNYSSSNTHEVRIKEYINKLFENNNTQMF